MVQIDLPWPPSVNRIWRNVGYKTLLSSEGRKYYKLVQRFAPPLDHLIPPPYRVEIDAFPPDRRRRDLDNILKVGQDSLVKMGIIEDDYLIDEIHLYRKETKKPGRLEIRIYHL